MTKTTRLALIYSDGSLGLLTEGRSLDHAFKEAKDSNFNEHNPANFTRVGLVSFEVLEIVTDPDAKGQATCPTCGAVHAAKEA